jgi:hypothetical protein
MVVVAEGSDNPALLRKEVELTNVHFINPLLHLRRILRPLGAEMSQARSAALFPRGAEDGEAPMTQDAGMYPRGGYLALPDTPPALPQGASFVNSIELTNKGKKLKQSVHGLIRPNKGCMEMEVYVRVRYRQPLFKAVLKYHPRKSAFHLRESAVLVFEHGQKFIAPGQSAVWYSKKGSSFATSSAEAAATKAGKASAGREMLGGGVII